MVKDCCCNCTRNEVLLWKRKALKRSTDPTIDVENTVSVEDIKQAELYWLRQIQAECGYSDEIKSLQQHKKIHPKSSLLCLDPFLDEENLLKVGGRLRNSELQEEQRQQVILPSHHELVAKIIQSHHERLLHAGVEHVLSSTRRRLWIIHGRREVKKAIAKCRECKRWSAPPACQKAGQLPRERVVPEPCFTNVGMDFAGPFYLKETKAKVRSTTKAYVCLFSCMSSRAVHLELVMSMDTERVLMALRRLFARRGLCQTIWTDNFKSFKSASQQLRALWKRIDVNKVSKELTNLQIKWKFIPERAPHMGGFYERMVKSVKIPLKKVLRKALVNAEEFTTILTEIEGQINSRPLTQVNNDPNDLNAITPAHLMLGKPLYMLPSPSKDPGNITMVKKWKHRQRITTHSWNRWTKEYLTTLTQYKKWMKTQTNLKIGDIVLISEANTPRGLWRLGKVVETYPSTQDGLVRVVKLKTQKGELKRL